MKLAKIFDVICYHVWTIIYEYIYSMYSELLYLIRGVLGLPQVLSGKYTLHEGEGVKTKHGRAQRSVHIKRLGNKQTAASQ